jgi:endonuclease III
VKNAPTYTRRLAALLKKLKAAHPPATPGPAPDPLAQLVVAFLQCDATRRVAHAAHQRINAALVDCNDLRVSHPNEVIQLLGERYPKAVERAGRLLDALQEIFVRERCMSLATLTPMGKKEARAYLDSLPGMTPYVSALIMVTCFEGHAIPVDDTLAHLLIEADIVAPDTPRDQIESFLEHHVKAGEALEAHMLLQAWADAGGADGSAPGGARAKAAGAARRPPTAKR